jgi:hypothetical protein
MGFAAGVCLSEVPSPPRFLFGGRGSSNLVGPESGQILQSVELLHTVIWSAIGLNTPLPATHCLYYCTLTHGRVVGGGVEPERMLEGQ